VFFTGLFFTYFFVKHVNTVRHPAR
jgi:hypothetical protein